MIATRLDPARTVVRVNPTGTADHALDLKAVAATDYTTVMLAKSEHPDQVRALAPLDVVVLVETRWPRSTWSSWCSPTTRSR